MLDVDPMRLEQRKRYDLDIFRNKSSYYDDRVLPIHVDLYDHSTEKAYMIERPVRIQSEARRSAFLSEALKLLPMMQYQR